MFFDKQNKEEIIFVISASYFSSVAKEEQEV